MNGEIHKEETIKTFRENTLPKYLNLVKYKEKEKYLNGIEKQQREIMKKIKRYIECYYDLKKEHKELQEKKEKILEEIQDETIA